MPVTCGEVENTFVESAVSEKPVMNVAAAGLTPRSPVIAEVGTVEIPLFARTTKSLAAPSFTGSPEVDASPVVEVVELVEVVEPVESVELVPTVEAVVVDSTLESPQAATSERRTRAARGFEVTCSRFMPAPTHLSSQGKRS